MFSDAKIRASDKDLPVPLKLKIQDKTRFVWQNQGPMQQDALLHFWMDKSGHG